MTGLGDVDVVASATQGNPRCVGKGWEEGFELGRRLLWHASRSRTRVATVGGRRVRVSWDVGGRFSCHGSSWREKMGELLDCRSHTSPGEDLGLAAGIRPAYSVGS